MKVDVTKIEGYEAMTADEKIKAIESYEFEEPDMSGYVTKDTFDKTASELAKTKKDLKAKMSEDEQRAIEEKERTEKMEAELKALKHEKAVAQNKAQFLSLGYSDELANASAEALAKGNFAEVFENQRKHLESVKTQIKSDLLAQTPYPQGGSDNHGGMTKDEFKKMSFEDRYKWSQEHPEEFKLLYS